MTDILFLNIKCNEKEILTVFPPVGILSMSSMLKKNDYSVAFIDADVHRLSPEDVLKKIASIKPKVIGVTLNVAHVHSFDSYILPIQKKIKDIEIVVGGPYVNSKPDEIFTDFPNIKHAIFGEGEYAILDFMEFIDKKRNIDDVRNLIINKNGASIRNRYERIVDLNALPLPDYDLVKDHINLYSGAAPSIAKPSIALMCARGCPFKCTFCSSPLTWDGKVTYRSVESIINEIEYLIESIDVKEIFFQDDTFNLNHDWYFELLNEIIKRGLNKKIYFKTSFRLNSKVLNKEVLETAREANFWMIFFGVESGNQKMLDMMNKNLTIDEIIRGFKLTREAGIASVASFMIGNIGETKKTVNNSIDLMKKIKPDFAYFSVAAPFPGTQLYSTAKAKGYIVDDNFKNYRFGDHILRTEKLSIDEIGKLAEEGNSQIYSWLNSEEYIKLSKKFTFADLLYQYKIDKNDIDIELNICSKLREIFVNEKIEIPVNIKNKSKVTLKSAPPFPVCFSYHWKYAANGEYAVYDGLRTQLAYPLEGNSNMDMNVSVLAPQKAGSYILELSMVQEGQFWFEQKYPKIIKQFKIEVKMKKTDNMTLEN